MKLTMTNRLGIGAGIGFGVSLIFYLIFWNVVGNLLAGSQSAGIVLISILFPTGWGAVQLGFYTERMTQFQKSIARTILVAVAFVLAVFLWRYAASLLPSLLSGKLLALAQVLLTMGFLAVAAWKGIMLVIRRPMYG